LPTPPSALFALFRLLSTVVCGAQKLGNTRLRVLQNPKGPSAGPARLGGHASRSRTLPNGRLSRYVQVMGSANGADPDEANDESLRIEGLRERSRRLKRAAILLAAITVLLVLVLTVIPAAAPVCRRPPCAVGGAPSGQIWVAIAAVSSAVGAVGTTIGALASAQMARATRPRREGGRSGKGSQKRAKKGRRGPK
jgi:hypothetical protein